MNVFQTGLFGLILAALFCAPVNADSLKSAVRDTITSNPELRAGDANFRALIFELLQAQDGFDPVVSLYGDIGQEYVDDPAGLSVADNARAKFKSELGVAAELTLYDGRRTANEIYAAAARVDRSAFELLDASETMALMVSEQYINIARQQALLRAARNNIAALRDLLRQADALVEGGRLPASDRFQIEAALLSSQASVQDIEQRLIEAGAQFKRLTGYAPRGTFAIPSPVHPRGAQADFVRHAIYNSHRVKVASTDVEVRTFEQGIADADFQPQVTLNAGASVGNNLDGSSGSERRAFVGVGVTWQLYGGRRHERRLSLSERKNEALYRRMAVIREVESLATSAWGAFHTNQRRLDLLTRQVRSFSDLRDSYSREFELTTRTVLDILVAENRLYNARVQQINAAAVLSFSGFRALAAGSGMARHFGVPVSDRVLGTPIAPEQGERPLGVVDRGRSLLGR
ncbi:MAG: TolC family protein [Rhodobacteraceae bacterium]|nr:TolC family protein [Paracoccaceae bacterium]